MSINIKPIITAFRAVNKAYGSFKREVLEQFKGCETPAQYDERRKAVNAAIDKAATDKVEARLIQAKIRTVLNRDILKPANIKLNERKGGRKAKSTDKATATPAKGGKATATPAKGGKAAVQPTLQAATVADVLSILPVILAGKSKADAIAVRDRIVASLTTIIATLK
jgi:hypothetical protein